MRFFAVLLGFISCAINGLIVGIYSGHYLTNALYAGFFGAIFALIFFKYEVLPGDKVFSSEASQILMSNAWLYWISNFLTAVVFSAWHKIGYFWGGFICSFLSFIVAMIVLGVGAGILSNFKTQE